MGLHHKDTNDICLTQDYHILIARLEEHFECSPTFSLQKFYYFVQPTLHRTFLIYELLQDLSTSPAEADVSAGEGSGALPEEDVDSDDDDRFGGGKAMKEALKQMSAGTDQQSKPIGWAAGGPVKGGEILTIIEERLQRTSGCVH
jgi:gamma-tubulin complex component 2